MYNDTMNSTKERWKAEYRRLYLADLKKRSPVWYADSPQPDVYLVWPKVKTANGLTKAICNFLKWNGHYSNRINTQGQARTKKIPKYSLSSGKVEYLEKVWHTKSTTRRGTADIDSIIYGRAVKIEVKVGVDVMSEWQVKEKERVEAAGGLYYLASDMEAFYQWYISTFEADPDFYTTPEGY